MSARVRVRFRARVRVRVSCPPPVVPQLPTKKWMRAPSSASPWKAVLGARVGLGVRVGVGFGFGLGFGFGFGLGC